MHPRLALPAALALALACAAPRTAAHRADLLAARPAAGSTARIIPIAPAAPAAPSTDGAATVADYQRRALRESPEVRAAWSRWQAGVEGIAVAGRLPEPTVSYGYFLSAIETRVGPQRHRLGIGQGVPWPGAVRASIQAADERASAEELGFDAVSHRVAASVAEAYWRLWLVRVERSLVAERATIEDGLLDAERRRVALGQAPLAALSRREISALRIADRLAGLAEREREAEAALRAAVGLPPDAPTPTAQGPDAARGLPDDTATLRAHAEAHPRVEALDARSQASLLEARRRAADRLPTVGVAADWVEVGPARMDGVPDSGKDVFMLGVSMRVPLAARSVQASVDAARADAAMYRAEADSAALRAEAELESALARIRDTARRDALVRGALIPRAEAAIASLTGSQGPDASTTLLDARADLVDLRVEAATVAAEHEIAWAWLAWIVGHPVDGPTPPPTPGSE